MVNLNKRRKILKKPKILKIKDFMYSVKVKGNTI